MTQAANNPAAGGNATEQQQPDMLGMSDDDFLKLNEPPAVTGSNSEAVEAAQTVDQVQENKDKAEESNTNTEVTSSEAQVNGGSVASNAQVTQEEQANAAAATAATSTEGSAGGQSTEGQKDATASTGSDTEAQSAAVNYEAEYKRIMAPFKANGRMIELKSVEEAVQLMQMGANFTRKMQDIAPHRKVLLMLQNNGIDEGKLSYLIDLDKKNPQAIQKLVKDAGIDPLDIDTSVEPAYQPGNHQVSDEQANFTSALNDLSGSAEGQKTLAEINSTWDQTSKEALWKSPEIMTVIHAQRETGVYDRIAAEVDRQRMLGTISPETSFLQAYKQVGDQMVAAANSAGAGGQQGAATAQPVATTVAAPKPTVANGDQASAASSTRTSPRKAETFVNPLAMSDDEFLKKFENRV